MADKPVDAPKEPQVKVVEKVVKVPVEKVVEKVVEVSRGVDLTKEEIKGILSYMPQGMVHREHAASAKEKLLKALEK